MNEKWLLNSQLMLAVLQIMTRAFPLFLILFSQIFQSSGACSFFHYLACMSFLFLPFFLSQFLILPSPCSNLLQCSSLQSYGFKTAGGELEEKPKGSCLFNCGNPRLHCTRSVHADWLRAELRLVEPWRHNVRNAYR